MSSSATMTPAAAPDARITFAAPRLPLPTMRRSAAPYRRARIRANGIDPIKYAAPIAMAMSIQKQGDPFSESPSGEAESLALQVSRESSTRERGVARTRRREAALIERRAVDARTRDDAARRRVERAGAVRRPPL